MSFSGVDAESRDQVRVVRFDEDAGESIQKIRFLVFTREQQVDPVLDLDGRDPEAVHVLAVKDGKPAGTGRMLDDGHIGRVAVLKEARGRGIGKQMILALIREADTRGMSRVFLGAQKQAVGFYEKLGFRSFGLPYEEAGIIHIHMEKLLG